MRSAITSNLSSAVIDSNLRRRNRNTAANQIEIEIVILVTRIFDFYKSLKTFFQTDVKKIIILLSNFIFSLPIVNRENRNQILIYK